MQDTYDYGKAIHERVQVDIPKLDGVGVRQVYGSWLDNYFVPRGYAVAFVDMPGTFRSTGCSDVGAKLEVLGREHRRPRTSTWGSCTTTSATTRHRAAYS